MNQVAQIFKPLFDARAQSPALPEVYELIARVWLRAAFGPTRNHLAVLNEGIRLFPRRVDLLYRTAALCTEHGYSDDAAAIITLGLHVATDEAARARFTELQGKLAAGLPPPPN